jgi:hypothetical protein
MSDSPLSDIMVEHAANTSRLERRNPRRPTASVEPPLTLLSETTCASPGSMRSSSRRLTTPLIALSRCSGFRIV